MASTAGFHHEILCMIYWNVKYCSIFAGGLLIIQARFRGKYLGTALQMHFIGPSLALLFGPVVHTLFGQQRNM